MAVMHGCHMTLQREGCLPSVQLLSFSCEVFLEVKIVLCSPGSLVPVLNFLLINGTRVNMGRTASVELVTILFDALISPGEVKENRS